MNASASRPVCIQCGVYIVPPDEAWTAIIGGERHGPLHTRCKNGLARRLMAYPCRCGTEAGAGSVVLAVDPSRSTPDTAGAP